MKSNVGRTDMENIFEGARFGEIYVTKDGKKNSFCSFCDCNGENVARLYREGWGLIIVRLDGKAIGGLEFGRNIDFDIIGKWEEPASEQKQTVSTCKWHTMDEEPLETGVILYSDRANRIYDGSYIGGGRFDVDRMSVPAGNFTLWCQRSEFFKECKLRESLDKLEE